MAALCWLAVLLASTGTAALIVDTHVHLTNLSLFNYTWLPQFQKQLGFSWTLANYSQASADAPFRADKVVFIEVHVTAPHWLEEARYIQSLAAAPSPGLPEIGAIVAYAPLEQGANVSYWLDRLKDQVPLLRGVRRPIPGNLSSPPVYNPCGYTGGQFLNGVRTLADFGLHFEFLIEEDPAGLHCAADLVQQAPDVTFVVEHLGSPDIAGNASFATWADSISKLAAQPNTYLKLSGAPREDLHNNTYDSWSVEDIAPYAKHVFDTFGYDRVMFGGNWFFVNLATSFKKWAEAVTTLLESATGDQRAAVLGGTAARVYRIN